MVLFTPESFLEAFDGVNFILWFFIPKTDMPENDAVFLINAYFSFLSKNFWLYVYLKLSHFSGIRFNFYFWQNFILSWKSNFFLSFGKFNCNKSTDLLKFSLFTWFSTFSYFSFLSRFKFFVNKFVFLLSSWRIFYFALLVKLLSYSVANSILF